ncbi:MAG: hypothetical protein V2A73_05670 [Pseudomonadota bacterium]
MDSLAADDNDNDDDDGEGKEIAIDAARVAASLWSECEKSWGSDGAHEAFLAHCRKAGTLAYAARCYRAALAKHGADDPVCASRLRQVKALALCSALKPQRQRGAALIAFRGWLQMLAAFFLLVVVGFAVAMYFVSRSKGHP